MALALLSVSFSDKIKQNKMLLQCVTGFTSFSRTPCRTLAICLLKNPTLAFKHSSTGEREGTPVVEAMQNYQYIRIRTQQK